MYIKVWARSFKKHRTDRTIQNIGDLAISPQHHLPVHSQGETPAKVITLHLSLNACEHIFLLAALSPWRVACVKITDGVLIGKAFHDALQIGTLGNAATTFIFKNCWWRPITSLHSLKDSDYCRAIKAKILLHSKCNYMMSKKLSRHTTPYTLIVALM